MLSPATLIFALCGQAVAAPLELDPKSPPELLGRRDGLPVYRYGPRAEWRTLPAVVISLTDGATPPPGARPLGGPYWRLEADDPVGRALALTGSPGVRRAFPDVVIPMERRDTPDFDDPSYGGQWYIASMHADELFAISLGDPSVNVAIIDSGIDISHVDLVDAVDDPYDAHDDDDDPSPDPGEYCTDGSVSEICDEHGTATSGIVGARANNGAGIVGLCPECRLIPIKMLGEPDRGISVTVAAFEHAIEDDVAVINNSWGYVDPTPTPAMLAEVIERARTEPRGGLGALVVFAAGNDDRELDDDEMTSLPGVLCVSAADSYGRWTNYTNYGNPIDIAAPSATVTIAPGDEVITNFGGTSAAAPVASGVAGWVVSQFPDMSADELHDAMIAGAVMPVTVTPDEDGHHAYFGYGELDAEQLLSQLYPEAETGEGDTGEKPGGCACSTTRPPGGSAAWLLGTLALLRRRRR